MQPHAETVQQAGSWVQHESDYFPARATPRASLPCSYMSLCNTRDRNMHLGVGQEDHSSPNTTSFRSHSTVKKKRTQLRLLCEDFTLARKIKVLHLQSHLVPWEKRFLTATKWTSNMGGSAVENELDHLKARLRCQITLIRSLLLCCLLHGICRSKEEQMAQGRVQDAQTEPRSPAVPATACSLTQDKWGVKLCKMPWPTILCKIPDCCLLCCEIMHMMEWKQ